MFPVCKKKKKMDCIYQLLLQFPQAFEYNETLLIDIMDEVIFIFFDTLEIPSYGTFSLSLSLSLAVYNLDHLNREI